MKRFLHTLSVCALLTVPLVPQTAAAANCSAVAAREAGRTGGKVVKVRQLRGSCRIVIVVPQPGKPPKRIVVTRRAG